MAGGDHFKVSLTDHLGGNLKSGASVADLILTMSLNGLWQRYFLVFVTGILKNIHPQRGWSQEAPKKGA
ncbi:hypothetical protein DO021_21070 [Desulfobacter hydrogenophilus]|uniref:Uncharacterized protein n=1 Tax=Desulfobacter hydrogenophilus TaxID=2291 RepID=A0A328F6C0_9BACT|nr:hypothetical protein [Desulfobacter hydrogenophilus]NDY74374.1 hypothetical protein [Desulfobacter hydrogenophilus]QBH13409.1 hypothetical protein EYB58_11035 [Desulfobacter hydrogenophilus]RAM00061.1 hypothetical protein DO021_21070 [Desulfobacter hydrogenophilus]